MCACRYVQSRDFFLPSFFFAPELRDALQRVQNELNAEKRRKSDLQGELSRRDAVIQDMVMCGGAGEGMYTIPFIGMLSKRWGDIHVSRGAGPLTCCDIICVQVRVRAYTAEDFQ